MIDIPDSIFNYRGWIDDGQWYSLPRERLVFLIAPFNNKRILKFKTQLTIVLFTAANYIYIDNGLTLKNRVDRNPPIIAQSGSKLTSHSAQT